jgi:hypothetical protein
VTALRSLRDLVKTLHTPQPEPTPEPPPATPAPEPTPPGCVRLGGGLYRLPRSGDAESAAAELRLMAECFGTVDEMRALGVPEARVQKHIPREAPVAAPPKPKETSTTMGITTATYDRLQDHDAAPKPEPKPAEAPKPATGRSTAPERARVGEIIHVAASTGTDCIPNLCMKVLIPDPRPGRESERLHPRAVVVDLRAPGSPSKTLSWNPSPKAHENEAGSDGYPREGSYHRIAECPFGR